MIWKSTFVGLKNTHSFLSPSSYHWLNYSREKLIEVYEKKQQVKLGTEYHALAEQCIRLSVRLPHSRASLNSFVNDAIGFRMVPEQILFYSQNCYGTADAISFDEKTLRIHDLKTGRTPGSINQLLIYAAIFCLDYVRNPNEFDTVLRLYQEDEIIEYCPNPIEIIKVEDTIIEFDKIINDFIERGVIT